jgi:hypothetical protein
MVRSRDQHAGRSHNIESDNTSFERVEEVKYLGTALTSQTSIHLVQNLLSSTFISKV